jgi:hypothetical protein
MQEAADIVGQLLDGIEDVSAIVETGGGLDGALRHAFGRRLDEYMLMKVVQPPVFLLTEEPFWR